MSNQALFPAAGSLEETGDLSLGALYRLARDVFRKSRIDTPELDARLLVAAAAGVRPQELVLRESDHVAASACELARGFVAARLEGRSVARILGSRGFWGLEFSLSPATLEPRPDTETLVEVALEWCMANGGRDYAFKIADLGVGTGAVAISLLSELPCAVALGVDISWEALEISCVNAVRNHVGDRLLLAQANFNQVCAQAYDLIVSNPPYIPTGHLQELDEGVRKFDPVMALDGGEDGMDAYRAIIAESRRCLRPGGALAVEIGWDQAEGVANLLDQAGMVNVSLYQDLAGKNRALVAKMQDSATKATV